MKKVLILSTIWGHKSVGKAIYDVLSDAGYEAVQEVLRVDPFSSKSYKTFYRFFPWLFTATFQMSKSEKMNRFFDIYFEKSYLKTLEQMIKKHRPEIVISSYFAFDSSIEKLNKKYKFRYYNAFTDPRTFSNIHISRSGINLVFDQTALNKVKKLAPNSKSLIVGWFAEKKYYQKLSKNESRKKIGVDESILTFCITGGSEGTYDVLKIISSLASKGKRLQILFMCGKNKQLFELVNKMRKIFPDNITLIPFAYTNDMNLFFKASDLVIGKAGPSTIFESVACLVPFFAITHITGQEDGNLEVIRKYNLGLVEENPLRASKKIKQIIKNPSILDKFQKPIKKLSEYNQKSAEKLIKIIA